MARNKNVPDQAAAESSRNGERKTVKNLRAFNGKLVRELKEAQSEIQQLHQQINLATERLELAIIEINELEIRLLSAVEDKHEIQRKLNLILQQSRDLSCLQKAESEKTLWEKKWIYRTVRVTAILFASSVVVTLFTKSSRLRN